MKLSKYSLMGIISILLAILIFFSNLDILIRPFTQIFLMGSSKGKDILFFGILGLFLILIQIFEYESNNSMTNSYKAKNDIITKIFSFKIINKFLNIFKLENKTYLKFSIILFLAAGIFGLVLEIYMRFYLGIAPFTIFVAMNPQPSTTSILHSHIFKSAIGSIMTYSQTIVPTGINTGDSLSSYAPKIANIIIIILPLLFLSFLMSLKKRLSPSSLILIFAATCGLIGLFDGGFFSIPYIIGIYGMLFVYFDEEWMNYSLGRIFKNKYIVDNSKDAVAILKKSKIKSKVFIVRLIPHVFLLSIILFGVLISIIGTNTEYYELDIMNPTENIHLDSSYSLLSTEEKINKTSIAISSEYNEMDLLNSLANSLENKCSSFSLTWNFFSYFK
ncbi:MAG: hypothetical protein FWH29_02780 [Methanobrevibacter sp.]|nr:hypothetical protein [Methanobrevibacter sp.]